jgi:hypothetical protein
MHGGPEQIHLEAWRIGAPLLQVTEASREVCMDSRGRPSPCSAQGLLIQGTSPHGSSQKGVATALPRCDYSCGQYCHRCRAAGRRPRLPSPATSLLRQRGPIGIQGTLSTSIEAIVCSAHYLAKVATLFPGVVDLRCHLLPARRHPAEPRCYWKDLQVDSRTRCPQHRLQATNSHQVACTSRLHGRVAGKSTTYSN